MKKYSLEELREIYDSKHYVTKERFVKYATNLHEIEEHQAGEMHKVYKAFPRGIYDNSKIEEVDKIIQLALDIANKIKGSIRLAPVHKDSHIKEVKLLLYKDSEKPTDSIKEIELDFHSSEDIIFYADLLKKEVKIVALLNMYNSFFKADKTTNLFEGDIYSTEDKLFNASDVYIVTEKCLKKLLYTYGKGYMRNGEPDIDEEGSYNHHALTMRECFKLGNIYKDANFLVDKL